MLGNDLWENIYLGMDAKTLHDMDLLSRGSGNIVALKEAQNQDWVTLQEGNIHLTDLGYVPVKDWGDFKAIQDNQVLAGITPQVGWDKKVV